MSVVDVPAVQKTPIFQEVAQKNSVQPDFHKQLLLKLRTIFIVAILTLLLAEGAARSLVAISHPTATYSKEFDKKLFIAQTKSKAKDGTIVFLGDSKINRGIYPELISQSLAEKRQLDLQVKNLALAAGTPDMALFMLKESVRSSGKPKLVVFNLNPAFFKPEIRKQLKTTKNPQFHLLKTHIGRCTFKPSTRIQDRLVCWLESKSYLLQYRNMFKKYLQDSVKAWQNPIRSIKRDLRPVQAPKLEVSPGGWSPLYPFMTNAEANTVKNIDISRWDESLVQPLVAYCKQDNIPLLLVWMPEYQTHFVKNGRIVDTYFPTQFEQFADRSGARFLNLFTSEPRLEFYYNHNHLNAQGAIQISKKIAQILAGPEYSGILSNTLAERVNTRK
jgi:hypothetical protein